MLLANHSTPRGKLKQTDRASLQARNVKVTPHPPTLYREVKVNSNTDGEIEKKLESHPMK